MRVLQDLFTSDVGLMSAAGLAFMLGIGAFFVRYFLQHIQQDAARASGAAPPRPAADAKPPQSGVNG